MHDEDFGPDVGGGFAGDFGGFTFDGGVDLTLGVGVGVGEAAVLVLPPAACAVPSFELHADAARAAIRRRGTSLRMHRTPSGGEIRTRSIPSCRTVGRVFTRAC